MKYFSYAWDLTFAFCEDKYGLLSSSEGAFLLALQRGEHGEDSFSLAGGVGNSHMCGGTPHVEVGLLSAW